jgi:hypothetical protein
MFVGRFSFWAKDCGAHKCVAQSVPRVMEELRRIARNERSKDSDLCDSANSAEIGLTANRFLGVTTIFSRSLLSPEMNLSVN